MMLFSPRWVTKAFGARLNLSRQIERHTLLGSRD
jgi:hypothetical protein